MHVPVIDLAEQDNAEICSKLYEACSTAGFFYVKNHGISEEQIAAQFEQNKQFFKLSSECKQAFVHGSSIASGYKAAGTTIVHATQTVPETREIMRVALSDVHHLPTHNHSTSIECVLDSLNEVATIWPSENQLPHFKKVMSEYFVTVADLANKLLRLIAMCLELEETFFLDDGEICWQTLSLLHYLPCITDPDQGAMACGTHKDRFCLLTLLSVQNDSSGLEALSPDGSTWFEVPPIPGTFIVNVGLLLEHWTGGKFPAVLHRVLNRDGQERYSTAFFRGHAFSRVIAPIIDKPASNGTYAPLLMRDHVGNFASAFSLKQAE